MSLDYGMVARMIVGSFTKSDVKEKYEEYQIPFTYFKMNMYMFLYIMLSITLGLLAFSLSWNCNTALGYHTALKALFGACAFVFGMTYILLYIVMRWDTCGRIMGHRR